MTFVTIKGFLPQGCKNCPLLATSPDGLVCRAPEFGYDYPVKIDAYYLDDRDESCPLNQYMDGMKPKE